MQTFVSKKFAKSKYTHVKIFDQIFFTKILSPKKFLSPKKIFDEKNFLTKKTKKQKKINCDETLISPKHQPHRRATYPEGAQTSTAP